MANEVKMPQLSDTMSSGKILNWYKKVGDAVKRGEMLAEVETDKANLEIESFQDGVLLNIVTPPNTTANVGDVIAIIGQAGETLVSPSTTTPAVAAQITESAPATASATSADQGTTETISNEPGNSIGDRIKASPLAKKIARELNINLQGLSGSGPNGRIIRKDLETDSSSAEVLEAPAKSIPVKAAAPVAPTPRPAQSGPLTGSHTELSKMRATIARRMQESVQTSPHFYMTTSIDMRAAKKLRMDLKVKEGFKGLSLNHFIIKAAAAALEKVPVVNAAMQGDKVFQPDQINIGVITALDGGLLIPVLKEVNRMKLSDVAFETRALIERARSGRPSSADLSGGTFSISNMGMFDVENFTAIINPGQGSILAVSSMQETPIVENGKISVGLIMKVTLSVDHRIIDGVTAAHFLKHFKESLEIPALLLI